MKRSSQLAILVVVTLATTPAFGEGCRVTEPGEIIFSNDAISVGLPPDRKFVFRPDGAGFIDKDGALGIKVAWFRKVQGQLDITGHRIDAQAPRARAYIPDGYGDTGFQSSYVVFPTPGCWEVTASMGTHHLTFVVDVELIAPGPPWRFEGVDRGWRQTGG